MLALSVSLAFAALYASSSIFCARTRRLRSRKNRKIRLKSNSTATGTPIPVPSATLLSDDSAGLDDDSSDAGDALTVGSERLGDVEEATELGDVTIEEDVEASLEI